MERNGEAADWHSPTQLLPDTVQVFLADHTSRGLQQQKFGTTVSEAQQPQTFLLPKAGDMADRIIDGATLEYASRSRVLSLRKRGLTSLPPDVVQLKHLEVIDLSDNDLTSLPMELTQLRNLKRLDITGNKLTTLPPEIGQLTNLELLSARWNWLTELPYEIRLLTKLRLLFLTGNHLERIPPAIGALHALTELHLNYNRLTALPREIGDLKNLSLLDLRKNRLAELGPTLVNLLNPAFTIRLNDNPLNDPLPEIIGRGLDALRTYLSSLEDAIPNYEAKVLLVGEGNVGKTSLVAALQEEPFVEGRSTTHGIEIHSHAMAHPTEDLLMTVRLWDFGGQEVYRITHQFFFSQRALYLLVWNPREGQEQNEVEGWLRRIRLRVGTGARIIIVATHADERRPELDYPSLNRLFPEVLAGHYAISNRTQDGLDDLRRAISAEAARLPQMGQRLSTRWVKARNAILERAAERPQIPYSDFVQICADHGVRESEMVTLAEFMHDLGQIIYYGDDEGLRDVVVLNPEWLTKAIGYVLEDKVTREAKGILDHNRLSEIWGVDRDDGIVYSQVYYPYFLRLMEKFDVSYRLESDENRSLVAQLVPHERPVLPWEVTTAVASDCRAITLVCELSEPAPGLIAWLTVRHHDASTGKYWRSGVFLRHPIQSYDSEAILELTGETKLLLQVRAPSPDMFFNVLRDSIENLIRRRWPGLGYQLYIPCPGALQDNTPCPAQFPLKGLLSFRERGGSVQNCLACQSDHSVSQLLTGFATPPTQLQPELERLHQEMSRVSKDVSHISILASETAGSVRRLIKAVATEVTDCPRLFTISPQARTIPERLRLASDGYRIVLWCEHPGAWHPWARAAYNVRKPKKWLIEVGPYARLIFKTLRLVVPVATGAVGVALTKEHLELASQEFALMNTLVDKLPERVGLDFEEEKELEDTKGLTLAQGQGLRVLRVVLLEEDPTRSFGDLRRVHAASGEYLWVCPTHYSEYDPGLPVIPHQRLTGHFAQAAVAQ
ncbi:COR domain-containing protein [Micromonospora sp. NPDC126480]|uniref:COR domain-containing protein n=1 Tax=Micromonospora sp. NPDC126480 TaxID=3155312 RepID=UPI00333053AB